jgi:hypothetical protein
MWPMRLQNTEACSASPLQHTLTDYSFLMFDQRQQNRSSAVLGGQSGKAACDPTVMLQYTCFSEDTALCPYAHRWSESNTCSLSTNATVACDGTVA